MDEKNIWFLVSYFCLVSVLEGYYLSKHKLIFGKIPQIKSPLRKKMIAALSIAVSISLLILPAAVFEVISGLIMSEEGLLGHQFSNRLIYTCGVVAYLVPMLGVSYYQFKKLAKGKFG